MNGRHKIIVQNRKVRFSFEIDHNGMEMGGFFETYVDPLTEIIKEKDEQIEQKDEMLEQKDAQIAELLARIAELESAKAG